MNRTRLFLLAVAGLGLAGSEASAEEIRHRVAPGDTVPRLSWRYKIRAERIRAANGLRGDALTPGSSILIPGGGEREEGSGKKEEGSPRVAVSVPREEIRTAVPVERRRPPARATPERQFEPGPLPGPLPEPRDEPPLASAGAPRSASLGPGLSRELPRVPQERAEAVAPRRPGDLPESELALVEEPQTPPTTRGNPTKPAEARPGTPGQALIQAATRLSAEGIAYNGSWRPPGESSSWVMDCSNTSRWLFRAGLGVELPRTASDQYLALERAGKLRKAPRGWFSQEVDRRKLDRDLRTGDLLFWENTYKPVRRPDITHVMVFLGTDAQGRWMMAGSERAKGVNIYTFDPNKKKGGYSTFLGLFKHHGKFVAYGRGI